MGFALLFGVVVVGHTGRMLHQSLGITQTHCTLRQLHRIHESHARLITSRKFQRNHAAKGAHLLTRQ